MENMTIRRNVVFWGRVALLALAIALALGLCAARAEIVYSGTCGADGDNLTWTLDDEGTLIISGTGRMSDYYYSSERWGNSIIRQVIIEEGVTSIGDLAFYQCGSLTSITLPEGVTSIGSNAFESCSNLTSVTIPESVTSIGHEAFMACYNLNDLHIASIESWLRISFSDNSTSHPNYYAKNWFINGTPVTSIVIPENLTSISGAAFYNCSSLKSVTIPKGVISIGEYAFSGCSGLTGIMIPASVTSIGGYAFQNCSSLTSITIPKGVISIGSLAFSGCRSLTGVTLPDSVTSIGGHAFQFCSSLTSIAIPEGVTRINSYTFQDCNILTSISIPEGVTSIGEYVFSGCSSLTSITIPEGVTTIGDYAFKNCSSLTSIKIPDSVISLYTKQEFYYDILMSGGVFANCTALTSVTLGKGLREISVNTFSGCNSLTSIAIPDSVTTISDAAFSGCSSLTSITIPDSVTTISDAAFSGCDNLTSVYIPVSVTTFSDYILDYRFSGTVYCHEFSEADYWATDKGYHVVYVDDIDIESIRTLTLPRDFRLACGETRKLVVDVFPNYDHPVVTWASSAPEIASVEDGLVTAIAPGSAVITASLGDKTASVTVETYAPLQDFDVPAEVWVVAKKTLQLVPENITPEGASGDFTWAMADADIATVDETGLVSGRKPGDTTLTVTETGTGIVRTTVVHVCYPVDAISLEPETASLIQGQSFQLTANVTARTQTFVNKLVTFSSSDEAVAAVDQDGVVTAIGMGTAIITAASDDGVSATCEVTVREAAVLTLPADLTAIEAEAFMGDLSLESVIIPEGCASIGPRAFAGCANLLYVRIPAGTDVAEDAFEGCDNVVIDYME